MRGIGSESRCSRTVFSCIDIALLSRTFLVHVRTPSEPCTANRETSNAPYVATTRDLPAFSLLAARFTGRALLDAERLHTSTRLAALLGRPHPLRGVSSLVTSSHRIHHLSAASRIRAVEENHQAAELTQANKQLAKAMNKTPRKPTKAKSRTPKMRSHRSRYCRDRRRQRSRRRARPPGKNS